jgi:ABC-2 type transport system permease protein
MWAMVVKEFRQVRRDRRTLAMMILMPVVLLVVFGYAASFDVGHVNVSLMGPGAESLRERVPDRLTVVEVDPAGGRDEAVDALRRGKVVAVIVAEADSQRVLVDGSELFAARAVVQTITAFQQQTPGLSVEVLFNPTLDTSAVLVPGLGGLILLFVGTVVTSLGVVRERQAGTLEQLAVMPLRPRDVFVGKVAPYFLVAAVDLIVVLTVGTLLFDVPFNGSVFTLALGSVLFLFVTLGLGVVISSVSENQGQAIQLALMTLLPQVLLSGIIFPLSSMGAGVRWIGYLLPLTYFNQIARGVMVRGAPFDSLLRPLGFLALLGSLAFTLAVLRFRRFLGAGHRHA